MSPEKGKKSKLKLQSTIPLKLESHFHVHLPFKSAGKPFYINLKNHLDFVTVGDIKLDLIQ